MKKVTNIKKLTITAIVALIAVLIFLGGGQLLAGPPDVPPGLDIAIQVQEAHTPDLMANRDVIGTAVGLNENGRPVIQVYATTDQVRGIPNSLEGIPVIVKVTDEFVARCPQGRCDRPVPIGVSTGHPDITAGTIGCRVKDVSGDVYALSNNHIYADQNRAELGDNALQPGPYDGGQDPADKIGELWDFVPIIFNNTNSCDGSNSSDPDCNSVDAAIAKSSPLNLGVSTPSDGYGTPKSSTAAAFINQHVKKFGRTTKLTTGYVSGINATVYVCYECSGIFCLTCKKLARFVDQIIIKPGDFSAGGDSGSLIVTDDAYMKPVGLLYAGSSSVTIANRIDLVLYEFNVTVDDGIGGPCTSNANCDDGNACNGVETCVAESCQAGTPSCDDGNACTTDSCDPATGICSNESPGICCSSVGTGCTNGAECCSNKCTGKPGKKTCK